jgi:hypothetical protein
MSLSSPDRPKFKVRTDRQIKLINEDQLMNSVCHPSQTPRTALVVAVGLSLVALVSPAVSQTSLDDFESYADSAALQGKFSSLDDAIVTLGLADGVANSQSLNLELNNGAAGFDAFATYDLSATLDLTNVTSISFQVANTNANQDTFSVQLKDQFLSDITVGPSLDLSTISSGAFTSYSIDTSAVSGGLMHIVFKTNANSSFGSANLKIDNLQYIIPEPSSFALFSGLLALGYIMVRQRKCP